ncbi:N-ethylammeline chlorohydrolase [Streptococcus pneumoniae]|nr:N-ethylammeline chlorohydrolase [Streptococcus pneumoniae]
MKLTVKYCFEVVDRATWFEEIFEEYGRFEEIFEEYKMMGKAGQLVFFDVYRLVRQVS